MLQTLKRPTPIALIKTASQKVFLAKNHLKRHGIKYGCATTLMMISSLTFATDCHNDTAIELYNSSLYQEDASIKLQQLKDAVSLCPTTYAILDQLGDTYTLNNQHQHAILTFRQMLLGDISDTQTKQAIVLLKLMYAHDARGERLEVSNYAQKINQLKMNGMTWQDELETAYLELYEKNKQQLTDNPIQPDELKDALTNNTDRGFVVVALNAEGTPSDYNASVRLDMNIPFEFNDSTLTYEAKTTLDSVVNTLSSNSNHINSVDIIGHTDVRGEASYNQELSLRRANAVTHYLNQRLPSMHTKLNPMGLGETQPISRANNESAHALNRRVSFQIR